MDATAPGTARTPVKNNRYARALGTTPRYRSSASATGSCGTCSPAASTTGVSSSAPPAKPATVTGTPAGHPAPEQRDAGVAECRAGREQGAEQHRRAGARAGRDAHQQDEPDEGD